MLSKLVCVPEELEVVFPSAVIDTEAVWTDADTVMVELACPIPIPAPAETDNAPLDPFNEETLFVAFDEPLKVRLNEPAPEALARDMLLPPNNATLIAVPVIDVPPPLNDCVPAAAAPGPIIVMELTPVFRVMFAPAARTIVPVEVAAPVPKAAT